MKQFWLTLAQHPHACPQPFWLNFSYSWICFSPLAHSGFSHWLSQSAMPTYYSKTLVDSVNELLATPADKQSIITSWKKILQLLVDAKVMKEEKQLMHVK